MDASGFISTFIEYDNSRNHGYQVSHAILAKVDGQPFDLNGMVLMDFRDSHIVNELHFGNSRFKNPNSSI